MTTDERVRTGAALVGLAAIGTAAAGFLTALAPSARVVVVLVGGWVVPAVLCAPLLRFRSRAAAAAGAFFVSLSLHALFSEVLRLAGASFSVYAAAVTWALLLWFGVAFWVGWARRRGRPRRARPRFRPGPVLLGVGALVALAAVSRGPFTVGEDAFDHIGYVRRIVDYNSMRPDHVLAWPANAPESPAPDPRKGALHPAVAWTANVAAAEPVLVWSMLPLAFYPAFVLAFIAFSRTLLPTASLLFLCVGLFMLSYGGTAFQFAHAAAYGQNVAAAWYWMLAAVVLGSRSGDPARGTPVAPARAPLFVLAVLALGGSLVHAGLALHAGVLALSMLLFAGWLGYDRRRAVLEATLLAAAAAAGVSIRLGFSGAESNEVHSHVQGVLFTGGDWFVVSPMEILRQYGMTYLGALLLVPAVALLARRDRHARAVLALCVVPVGAAFVPPVATALYSQGSYMVARILLNAPVFAAGALVLGWMVVAARTRGFGTRAAVAAAVAVWSLAFLRPSLDATRADALSQRLGDAGGAETAPARQLQFLPAGSTVLSDPASSYLLSAYSPHRFVALYEQHANPTDPYALDRLEAVRDVLSPFVVAQRSIDACARYRVTFVIVNARAPSSAHDFMSVWDASLYPLAVARLRAMAPAFREVAATADYTAFRFEPSARTIAPGDPAVPPVVPAPEVSSCTVVAPERVFEVTGIAVTPAAVAAGDSAAIIVGYRRDLTSDFGLPFLIHVRFDHESIDPERSFPGDKHVRRYHDRRRGTTTRWRADFRPGAGVYDPDLWPMGIPLRERVDIVIPRSARPGTYRVEVQVVRDSMLPNFGLRDLLYSRDHYTGTPCASLEVTAPAGKTDP